jgi:hypothetical protein
MHAAKGNLYRGGTVFLYAGPDQIIPLASALSTIFGVVLIFWGKLLRAFHKIAGLSAPETTNGEDEPEA